VLVELDAAYDSGFSRDLVDSEKRGTTCWCASPSEQARFWEAAQGQDHLHHEKVSMEKGVCMNWPSRAAKSSRGLRFLQEENPELDVPGPDEPKPRSMWRTPVPHFRL